MNHFKGASELDSTSADAFRRGKSNPDDGPRAGAAATPARPVTALRFADGAISFVHPLPVDDLLRGPGREG